MVIFIMLGEAIVLLTLTLPRLATLSAVRPLTCLSPVHFDIIQMHRFAACKHAKLWAQMYMSPAVRVTLFYITEEWRCSVVILLHTLTYGHNRRDRMLSEQSYQAPGTVMTRVANSWTAIRYLAVLGYGCQKDIFPRPSLWPVLPWRDRWRDQAQNDVTGHRTMWPPLNQSVHTVPKPASRQHRHQSPSQVIPRDTRTSPANPPSVRLRGRQMEVAIADSSTAACRRCTLYCHCGSAVVDIFLYVPRPSVIPPFSHWTLVPTVSVYP